MPQWELVFTRLRVTAGSARGKGYAIKRQEESIGAKHSIASRGAEKTRLDLELSKMLHHLWIHVSAQDSSTSTEWGT